MRLQGNKIAGGDVSLNRDDFSIKDLVLDYFDQTGLLYLFEFKDLEEFEIVDEGVHAALHCYYTIQIKF